MYQFILFCITFISIYAIDLPKSQFILEKSGFTLCYDGRLKQAVWVLEVLTSDSIKGDLERDKFGFKEDMELPEVIRASLSDYKWSGYDRGHISSSNHHRSNENAMMDCFKLTNVCPMNLSFNRGGWLRLEQHVRQLARDYGSIQVFSGPLFIPKARSDGKKFLVCEAIGESNILVPTHFFKVIQAEELTESYILPNEKIPTEKPLSDYKVTVEKVERAAGLIFQQ